MIIDPSKSYSTPRAFTGVALLVGVIIMALHVSGCRTARHAGIHTLQYQYHLTDLTPLPYYTLFQFTDDSLRVWFEVPVKPIKEGDEEQPQGFLLRMDLYEHAGSKTIIDSASWFFAADTPVHRGSITGYADIFTGEPEGRHLRLVLTHLQHTSSFSWETRLPSSWPPSTTHFRLKDDNGHMLHPGTLTPDHTFSMESSLVTTQTVQVRYYRNQHPPALPPFVTGVPGQLSYQADSIFSIQFREGESETLQFTKPGMYHLITDTTSRTGFTMFVRAYPFPRIEHPSQMVAPLRYITTDREFKGLVQAADPQQAAEAFWLEKAGNAMRATRLLREYYRRVERANFLFSSYTDGWKTDRGMVYIVYGPPTTITRTERGEVWTYGESPHLLSLSFPFVRMTNPFTHHDYMLERSTTYKTGWHQRVSSWRR